LADATHDENIGAQPQPALLENARCFAPGVFILDVRQAARFIRQYKKT
jgi:hypothetical protein